MLMLFLHNEKINGSFYLYSFELCFLYFHETCIQNSGIPIEIHFKDTAVICLLKFWAIKTADFIQYVLFPSFKFVHYYFYFFWEKIRSTWAIKKQFFDNKLPLFIVNFLLNDIGGEDLLASPLHCEP